MRVLLLVFFFSLSLFAVNIQEINKIVSDDGASYDEFSHSIAISDNTVVVGAPGDDDSGSASGSAYVYELNTSSGLFQQVAKLTANDGAPTDGFGYSVSIDNDTIVIGARWNKNSIGQASGSAYVFEKPSNGWTDSNQTAKLTSSDGADGDKFGYSVAISENSIVIGAYRDDDSGTDSGSAYVFEKPENAWIDSSQENAKLTVSYESVYDHFGYSVAISNDTIAVGAYGYEVEDSSEYDNGAVYIYNKPENGWMTATADARLTANDSSDGDYFGYSVAIESNTLVVGASEDDNDIDNSIYSAGSVYIYKRDNSTSSFIQAAKLIASDPHSNDKFGTSVDISNDTVLVGAFLTDDLGEDSGSAYLYKKPNDGWTDSNHESAKLTAFDAEAINYFGRSVAISGSTIAIGSINDNDNGQSSGSAYMYEEKITTSNPAIIMYLLN